MHDPPADPLAPQPLSHSWALPAEHYSGPSALARDRRAVFAKSWQLVGHLGQLAGAGDHLVTELAGLPTLVVRDGEGAVRAFANVCRHRAGPLATHHGRGAKSLRCKYHGWTYGLDGALRGAPEMSATPDFVPSSVCLPALRVEVWHDLVFAAEAGAPPFADVMAGLEAPLGALSPRGFEHHQTVHYDVACNWKVYCDNYLEGYHVPHIHPTLDAVLDYRNYSTEVTPWASWQHSPLSSGDELYGSGEALYYFIYPNTMLNLLPGRLQSNRVIPTGPERCRVEFDYYYLPDPRPEAQRRRAADHDFARHVQDEDAAICEHVQRGLESGHYGTGRLNPLRENAVHAFHELLRAAYRADGA